uniref:NADH-ubiquinone oxidoreductase chain 5 n=1 Tax=Pyrocoelia analis TaxID=1453205 RepID=A0A8K1RGF3_9COLE|nr:NADH dehydrogenase subunit 5 [Pyrocoelia analis]UEN67848.1 NADH dehydrogenase subunit 5 [Pyrocoelia analis]UZG66114.1 NADH dehydrogenase subunit 5 [Pyrocoelia analis]
MSICLLYFLLFLFLSVLFFFMSLAFMIMNYLVMIEYELISLNSSVIYFTLLFDWISLLFMSFVLFISSMVILYSEEYMHGDQNLNRFIILVVLFVFSMMMMIISPNLISILLGWDGLGLVSFLLVIFYQNMKSLNAGMITALFNRLGDVAILLSISWMLNFGSWNFMFYIDFMKNDFSLEVVAFLVVIAAFTKSAQIPFSSWLPVAMAAPTPVSSLVHSSTLVTAGVYLLIRFSPCFNDYLIYLMLFISSLTMFMAGLGANFEFDLKKIIALSTLSQLGLMMSILFMGDSDLAFFHLLSHALFKALLFMCAGCMIHNYLNNQDIRYMGSMINIMPLTCSFFNICSFSLCGLPFLSGFYSKDLIIDFISFSGFNMYIYIIFYISIGLTVSYTVRLCYYLMFNNYNLCSFSCLNDQSLIMLRGMSGLIFMVIFSGSILSWLMFSTPYFICLSFFMKMMTLLMILAGFLFGLMIEYLYKLNFNFVLSMFFYSSLWNLSSLSTLGVNLFPLKLSGLYMKTIDQGWFEYFGVNGLFNFFLNGSSLLMILVNNSLKVYLLLFLIFIYFIFIYV